MGGLLAADALIEFVQTRPDTTAPLWPNIVACLAFDTPVCLSLVCVLLHVIHLCALQYLGLHPYVFKNGTTQAATYLRNARGVFSSFQSFPSKRGPTASVSQSVVEAPVGPVASTQASPSTPTPTSIWQKWAPAAYAVGGAIAAGAAAGAAYYKRDEIEVGYKWASDHMKYVGTLWDENALRRRLERLLEIEEQMGVTFRTWVFRNLLLARMLCLQVTSVTPVSTPSFHPVRPHIRLPAHSSCSRRRPRVSPSISCKLRTR